MARSPGQCWRLSRRWDISSHRRRRRGRLEGGGLREGGLLHRQLGGSPWGPEEGEAAAVSVGSADSGDTSGDETVVAGCWTVSTPDAARRPRVSGTRPRGLRAVSIREVEGNRPSIPATARMLAAAVTPYHQRLQALLGLYAVITSWAMGAAMGFCPAAKPVSSICVHSMFRTRGLPRACRATCRTAPGVKTVPLPAPACCKR